MLLSQCAVVVLRKVHSSHQGCKSCSIPVGDSLEVVAEVGATEVANADAVVDVEPGGQVVAAALDEAENVELVGGGQQPLHVFRRHVRLTRVRVVDDEAHHV